MALTLLIGSGCVTDVVGIDPPLDTIYQPVGIAVHPTGQYLYVVNSNFDLNFRDDRGGTVVVIDTDTLKILPEGTAQIGTFGGDIKLNSPADGEPTRAYVAVRGDNTVTALDLVDGGARVACKGSVLSSGCVIPTLNEDPFGLAVSTFDVETPSGETRNIDFVGVAHLLGGNVTGIAVLDGNIDSPSRVSASLVAGATDIARSPRSGHYYTTSRFTNTVVAFRPVLDTDGTIEGVFETGSVTIDNARPSGGFDSRGIAFNGDGTMAFVANRGPDSVVFIDVGPTNIETGSGTRNRVVDSMLMSSEPAELVVINVDGRELLYVTSFEDRNITVIDPRTRAIVDTVQLAASPYALAVDQTRHQRLYVTLFGASQIAAVDIDPNSSSFNQVVGVVR